MANANSSLRHALTGLAVVGMLAGCASTPGPGVEVSFPARRLAVVAVTAEPATDFSLLLRSSAEAAAEGGVKGAGSFALQWLLEACKDGLGCLVGLVTVPVVAIAGGVAGGIHESRLAAPAASIEKARAPLAQGMFPFLYQYVLRDTALELLRQHAVAPAAFVPDEPGVTNSGTANAYPGAAAQGAEQVLELAIVGVQAIAVGGDRLSLQTRVRGRLIDVPSASSREDFEYAHYSLPAKASEWLARSGMPVVEAVGDAVRELARALVEDRWVLYGVPQADGQDFHGVAMFGLPPIEPEIQSGIGQMLRETITRPHVRITTAFGMKFTPVRSVQPEFRWQPFPRPADLDAVAGRAKRFADVTYDIRVYSAGSIHQTLAHPNPVPYRPGKLVYQRDGLPAPAHRLEVPLPPCQRYVWTVRARFTLDGHRRWTEWSGTYDLGTPAGQRQSPSPRRLPPEAGYLPFLTPYSSGGPCFAPAGA